MITFKKTSRELTKVEQYLMTISPAVLTLNKVEDNTKIPVDAYAIYDSEDEETGKVTEILAILTKDKEVYATCSRTFKRSFYDMFSIFGTDFTCEKISGETKAGRKYINCILDTTGI